MVDISGEGIGPAAMVSAAYDSSGTLPKSLAGVMVTFGGTAAPLLSVQANRIRCVVPFAVLANIYQDGIAVQVRYNGLASNAIQLGLYSGVKFSINAVLNADSSANSQTNPARPGEIVTLYGSSFGQTIPASQDGQMNRAPLPFNSNISINVQDRNSNRAFVAQVLFAGAAVGQVSGTAQVNFVVPPAATQSEVGTIFGNGGQSFALWVSAVPR